MTIDGDAPPPPPPDAVPLSTEPPVVAPPAGPTPVRTSSVPWTAVLGLQVALGVVVSLRSIGSKSLWTDEGFSYFVAAHPLGPLLHLVSHREINMSGYYVFLHFWSWLGTSEAMLRLPSAIAAVATIPLLATIVDRTFGRRPAIVAGFLLAVSPMSVTYAQEARSYAMLALASTLSVLLFMRLVETGERRFAIGFVVATVAGAYLHFFAGLVVAAELVSLVALPQPRAALRRVAVPVGAVALLAVPLLINAVVGTTDQLGWVQPTSWSSVTTLAHWFSGELGAGRVGVALVVICLVAAAVWTVRSLLATPRSEEQWRRVLVWCWLLVPPVLTALLSLHQPLWVPRYLIVSLPACLALVAVGATRWVPPWTTVVVTLVLVVVALHSLSIYNRGTAHWGEDWRAAGRALAAQAAPNDPVLFSSPYNRIMVSYYARTDGGPVVDDAILGPDGLYGGRFPTRSASPEVIRSRLAAATGPVWQVSERGVFTPVADCETAMGLRPVAREAFGLVTLTRLERDPAWRPTNAVPAGSCTIGAQPAQ